MKPLFPLVILVFVLARTAAAEEENGSSLMERGAQQFLEGLLQEMEPAWQKMRDFMDEMGPAMLELMDEIKDWSVYDPPEILDNGDIIIRRKLPDSDQTAPEAAPDGLIEL